MISNRKTVIEMTIGLLVMAAAVQAATLIKTCPFVITSPGDYVLSQDLFCSGGGTGITITSSHVTLKFEGHAILSGPGSNGSAISNSSGGVTGTPVTDVHILGPGQIRSDPPVNSFLSGVFFQGSVTDSEVSGITVVGSRFAGIFVDGQAFGTTGLKLTKNTLTRGQVAMGILVNNLTSSTISENDASGNTTGIQIDNSGVTGTPIMLSRNIVNENSNTGLVMIAGFVTAQNNVVNGNGVVGIDVVGSPLGPSIAVEIINNKALGNGNLDLNDAVPNCAGSVWRGNTFFAANPNTCIH